MEKKTFKMEQNLYYLYISYSVLYKINKFILQKIRNFVKNDKKRN